MTVILDWLAFGFMLLIFCGPAIIVALMFVDYLDKRSRP